MSLFTRIRDAFRPEALSEDVEREMAFHLQQRADELVARGMSPDLARAEARRLFGNATGHQENTRDRDVVGWLESLVADARYAMRGLRAAPGFAAITIASLALGIGANTAIFTLVNVAMFKALPVPQPEELVSLQIYDGADRAKPVSFNGAAWDVVRAQQDVFSSVFAFGSTGQGDLSVGGESRPTSVGLVSGAFFSTLGVRPAVGRLLVDADDVAGCSGTAVLTHRFWRSEFGSDPAIVGRTLPINGQPFTVVGVAEPRFFGLEYGYNLPIFAPQCAGPLIRGGTSSRGGYVVGRLRPGITVDQATVRLMTLAPALVAAVYPTRPRQASGAPPMTVEVTSIERGFGFFQQAYGGLFLLLMAIVGIVLLIACANTANLLLARATVRQREMAVRVALGAGRMRLVRQLLTESLLLATASAVLGMWLALLGGRALIALLSSSGDPILPELYLDWRVAGFTMLVAALTAVIFGIAPAWRVARTDARNAMGLGGRGTAPGHSRFNAAKGLVVAQIALSLVMLGGASILIGSWRRIMAIETGFDTEHVLLVRVNTRAAGIADSARSALYGSIVERLRAIPGVALAASANRTPVDNNSWGATIRVDDANATRREGDVSLTEASDGYFATIGTRLLAGRDFAATDARVAGRVAIVNEELARAFFGRADAVGRRFRIDWRSGRRDYEIIGVVANTRDEQVTDPMRPMAFLSLAQNPVPTPIWTFAARGRGAPEALASAVSAGILELHPRLSLRTRAFESQIAESMRVPRTLGLLSGAFGALALLLASIGLYGIMSYSVARRRNEIGVRIALGADKARIIRMVLADVGRITVGGLVVGALLAAALRRALSATIAGVDASVSGDVVLAATILAIVAIAAASVPAWRASRQDPVSALRTD